jgi:hypothetical protein
MGYTYGAIIIITRLRYIIRLQKVHKNMCTVNTVGNCNFPILFTLSSVNKQLKHNTSTIKVKVIY